MHMLSSNQFSNLIFLIGFILNVASEEFLIQYYYIALSSNALFF